ncbi:MAG: dipicolinate synthase subunit B [Oscillospiraceae bacterium]|nr:dipicolinate synthase subunit B [Oscillospiraceae bacterium]
MGSQTKVGIGLTGSFCTFEAVFNALQQLRDDCPDMLLQFVLSYHTQQVHNRFSPPENTLQRCAALSKSPPILTIDAAEPVGPKRLLDIFVIAPCTGNTLAKLANGITDTPVLMAAKSHLRNGRPLLISLASNDALGLNLKNIGTLLNTKHVYFVPFGQDDAAGKPNSLVANVALLSAAMNAALEGRQLQPLVI